MRKYFLKINYPLYILFLLLVLFSTTVVAQEIKQPNVIIVITDDQGYGDLACNGNTIIKTPTLDKLYEQSIRLTDFHVSPTCAPSRSGLMTGRYANRVGVWHTVGGLSILRKDEVTMADVFQNNGYETAMFGKWHLGDTYPSRPQDKGFKYTFMHVGGAVGQTPDYWGNDYFDDTYLENGIPKKVNGYCTDVWFDKAIKYIETNKNKPFFCYISTNAPHEPYNVPKKYFNKYKKSDIPDQMKRFYGMITNVDDNLKRLQDKLKQLKIDNNTIVIFLTDNGTGAGYKKTDGKWYGFNANMRGVKTSEYEGGHRVPFFISYPDKIKEARNIATLTANIDVLPTLATLCKLELPNIKLDGSDISPLLLNKNAVVDREYLVTDSQRVQVPIKRRKSAVMSDKMRLINGKELYDISLDPSQSKDVAAQFPEIVDKMKGYYEEWWQSVSADFTDFTPIVLGSNKQNPVEISCHEQHLEEPKIPWDQDHIRLANKNPFGGEFTIEFDQSGVYEIEISRWPFEANLKLNEAVPGKNATLTTNKIPEGKALNLKKAFIKIGEWKEEKEVEVNSKSVVFEGNFEKGKSTLSSYFIDENNIELGAFYFRITRK